MAGGTTMMELVPTRGEPWGEPMDAPPAPGLRRFSFEALPNPLLAQGNTDAVWARGFRFQIEQALARMQEERLAKSARGGLDYAPMRRVEADIRELERARAMRKKMAKADALAGLEGGAAQEEHYRHKQGVADAAARIAWELDRSCAGNPEMEVRVLDRFWAKLAQEKFLSTDLMSLLLIAQEEVLWTEDTAAQGGAGGPAAVKIGKTEERPKTMPAGEGERRGLPAGLSGGPRAGSADEQELQSLRAQQAAKKAELEVRLISIREMLWHYFQAYPQDYPAALAAVLGVSAADLQDEGVMDERIAFEVARTGAWSLAMRVWQEIVRRQEAKGRDAKRDAREAEEWEKSGWLSSWRKGGRRASGGEPESGGMGGEDEARAPWPWGGGGAPGQGGATDPYAVGMVPPKARQGWWSLSPRWSGWPMGRLLASLMNFVTS